MSLEFINSPCKENPRTDHIFGICDDEDGTKAYTDLLNKPNWIATVLNNKKFEVSFIAVDKCVIKDTEFPKRGRCDGILFTENHLYFIELKNQMKSWITDAVEQLESTIEFFKESHDIDEFKHKKAFACNRKHRHFQEVDNELNLAFFRKHKVRIDIQAEIVVF